MNKKHNNALSDNSLDNVSGGIGMANPFDTPKKKEAYNQYKEGTMSVEEYAKIMNIDANGNPTK